jgi:hypothetical protein
MEEDTRSETIPPRAPGYNANNFTPQRNPELLQCKPGTPNSTALLYTYTHTYHILNTATKSSNIFATGIKQPSATWTNCPTTTTGFNRPKSIISNPITWFQSQGNSPRQNNLLLSTAQRPNTTEWSQQNRSQGYKIFQQKILQSPTTDKSPKKKLEKSSSEKTKTARQSYNC